MLHETLTITCSLVPTAFESIKLWCYFLIEVASHKLHPLTGHHLLPVRLPDEWRRVDKNAHRSATHHLTIWVGCHWKVQGNSQINSRHPDLISLPAFCRTKTSCAMEDPWISTLCCACLHCAAVNGLDTRVVEFTYAASVLTHSQIHVVWTASHPNYPLFYSRLSQGWLFGRKIVRLLHWVKFSYEHKVLLVTMLNHAG